MIEEGKYQSLEAITPLTYIHYHPVIKILTEEDYPKIKESNKMFCRKVISKTSYKLMDLIDNDRNKEEA
jgi:hypothetical protein